MARKEKSTEKGQDEGPLSRMGAVRLVLAKNPKLTAHEIVAEVKKDHGLDVDAKLAGVYKYQILKPKKKPRQRATAARSAAVSATPANVGRRTSGEGLDDLLRAADKLGWHRVKEVVDKIVQAPE
jgi:hypothetical protein